MGEKFKRLDSDTEKVSKVKKLKPVVNTEIIKIIREADLLGLSYGKYMEAKFFGRI